MPLTYVVVYQASSSVPAGDVISQSPAADEIVDPNSVVTIYISTGAGASSHVYFTERQSFAVFRMT